VRQREIEEQLREAARVRGQQAAGRPQSVAGHAMGPQMAHPMHQQMGGQPMGQAPRGPQRPNGAAYAAHPGFQPNQHQGPQQAPHNGHMPGPAAYAAFPAGHPANQAYAQPHPGMPQQPLRTAHAGAPAAYAPAPHSEPANHNTAPPERVRQMVSAMMGGNDGRPLPNNVVPMPDRSERMPSVEPATASAFPATSLELAQAALARVQAASVVAPHPMAQHTGSQPAPSASAAPADLGTLLRTVAVTQMRVAHDVAEAVHRIENRQATTENALGPVQGSVAPIIDQTGRQTIESTAQDVAATSPATATLPSAETIRSIEEAQPVREQQAWRDANVAIHDDMRRAFAGRGLAHDPGLDDAGSIAARYAPTQRPN
jgi:hypothetical protein